MKKLMCAALALMLALTMGVGALAEDATGLWYLNSVEMAGMSFSAATMGMENHMMEINADGTFTISFGDDVETGTWSVNENGAYVLSDDDDALEFVLAEDGTLCLTEEEDGMTVSMVFGREQAVAETFDAGAVYADPVLADFDGTWAMTVMDASGIQVPVTDMGLQFVLTIADGNVTLDFVYGDKSATSETAAATLTDGVLYVETGMDVEGYSELNLTLHEGLTYMSWSVDETTTCYFEKIDLGNIAE